MEFNNIISLISETESIKEIIPDLLENLLQMINDNAKNSEPYIVLSYLFFITGNDELSQSYLNIALNLSEDKNKILNLQKILFPFKEEKVKKLDEVKELEQLFSKVKLELENTERIIQALNSGKLNEPKQIKAIGNSKFISRFTR